MTTARSSPCTSPARGSRVTDRPRDPPPGSSPLADEDPAPRHGAGTALLTESDAEDMLTWWGTGGFSLDGSVRIEAEDGAGSDRPSIWGTSRGLAPIRSAVGWSEWVEPSSA